MARARAAESLYREDNQRAPPASPAAAEAGAMHNPIHYPLLVFAVSLVVLWLSAWFGANVLKRRMQFDEEMRHEYGVVLASTLTLLGLVIGFSFSMAVSRYDLRKTYEAEEANAIGTEYVRADLLPADDAMQVRRLLRSYLEQRILFYTTRDDQALRQIAEQTARLESELWAAARSAAAAQPNPIIALVVAGMNDVLNTESYTQAAWRNRMPAAVWVLMATIAIFGNVLLGYGTRRLKSHAILLAVLPLVVSVSFELIADIDSPRGGMIRLVPQNLVALAASLPQ